jgi:molybdate transport system regulatory protein
VAYPGYHRELTIPAGRPQLDVRLVCGSSIVVGPGKADLLTAIDETGSITGAGRAMGMSYKRAWYLLDTMNRCFRLIHATKGGRGFGGARLTPMGERVVDLYGAIEKQAAAGAAAELASLAELVVETPPEPGSRKIPAFGSTEENGSGTPQVTARYVQGRIFDESQYGH